MSVRINDEAFVAKVAKLSKKGCSMSQIAGELGCSRMTVRRALLVSGLAASAAGGAPPASTCAAPGCGPLPRTFEEPQDRMLLCEHYGEAVAHAARQDWRGFACPAGCAAYEPVSPLTAPFYRREV